MSIVSESAMLDELEIEGIGWTMTWTGPLARSRDYIVTVRLPVCGQVRTAVGRTRWDALAAILLEIRKDRRTARDGEAAA